MDVKLSRPNFLMLVCNLVFMHYIFLQAPPQLFLIFFAIMRLADEVYRHDVVLDELEEGNGPASLGSHASKTGTFTSE